MRRHFRIWWASRPGRARPLWAAFQLWFWLRWICWAGWRAGFSALRRHGPDLRREGGISILRQCLTLVRLTVGWGIPPGELYALGVMRDPARALDFVYDCETAGFHALRNNEAGGGQWRRDAARLADKVEATRVLQEAGLPVAPIRHVVPRGVDVPLAPLMSGGEAVFCKLRRGNQGLGAFAAGSGPEGLQGESFLGRPLPDAEAVEAAWRALLARGDALVQPVLETHPDLARLTDSGAAITLRHITLRQAGGIGELSALVEIPRPAEGTGRILYSFLPVSYADGRLLRFPASRLSAPQAAVAAAQWQRVPEGAVVPHWATLRAASLRAHRCFPDLWAIAWDWVVTPEGPVLLEGNSGWSLRMPQLLLGGFAGAGVIPAAGRRGATG